MPSSALPSVLKQTFELHLIAFYGVIDSWEKIEGFTATLEDRIGGSSE
jgi:hypothetical protein